MITEPLQIHDHVACERALEDLRARIDHIAGLLESRTTSRNNREQARDLLADLKSSLKAYASRACSDRMQARMSIVERTIYAPAVFDVLNDKLLIKSNTTPGPDWYHHLYDASGTVGWYLGNIRSLDPVEDRLCCDRCGDKKPDVRVRLNPIKSVAGDDEFSPLCDDCFEEGAEAT